MPRSKKKLFTGIEKDAPVAVNPAGGKQSASIYRCDLFDGPAILALANVLKKGAEKYEPDNWRLLTIEENLNHLLMHILAYMAGDRQDDHLEHAFCRAMFALAKKLRPNYYGAINDKRRNHRKY